MHGQEKCAGLYCLGESGISLCGSSCRQWSLSGSLRPGGVNGQEESLSAGKCPLPHTWTWDSHSEMGDPSDSCADSLPFCKDKMLEPLHPICAPTSLCQVCSETPSPLPGKPFCEGSANISGQSSSSFLSPTQKCFQGSSIASKCMFPSDLSGSPPVVCP